MLTESELHALAALAHRNFETQQLPRALELKVQVVAGIPLTPSDLHFLDEMLQDAERCAELVSPVLDLRPVRACTARLCAEIRSRQRIDEQDGGAPAR